MITSLLIATAYGAPLVPFVFEAGPDADPAWMPVVQAAYAAGEGDFPIGGPLSGSAKVEKLTCAPAATGATCSLVLSYEVREPRQDLVVYRARSTGTSTGPTDAETIAKLADLARRQLVVRPGYKRAVAPPEGAIGAGWAQTIEVARCTTAPLPLPGGLSKVLGSVVTIVQGNSTGTGFFVSKDGLLLTATHVIDGTEPIVVHTSSRRDLPATVVRGHSSQDVALIRVAPGEEPCLPVGTNVPEIGTELFALGAPRSQGSSPGVARGIVSTQHESEGLSYLQTDAAVNPGDSGGPMLSADGRAIAVNSWKIVGQAVEGLNFGAPIARGLALLQVDLQGRTTTTDPAVLTEPPAYGGVHGTVDEGEFSANYRFPEPPKSKKGK